MFRFDTPVKGHPAQSVPPKNRLHRKAALLHSNQVLTPFECSSDLVSIRYSASAMEYKTKSNGVHNQSKDYRFGFNGVDFRRRVRHIFRMKYGCLLSIYFSCMEYTYFSWSASFLYGVKRMYYGHRISVLYWGRGSRWVGRVR